MMSQTERNNRERKLNPNPPTSSKPFLKSLETPRPLNHEWFWVHLRNYLTGFCNSTKSNTKTNQSTVFLSFSRKFDPWVQTLLNKKFPSRFIMPKRNKCIQITMEFAGVLKRECESYLLVWLWRSLKANKNNQHK
jgi:hypothetical protein